MTLPEYTSKITDDLKDKRVIRNADNLLKKL